MDELKAIAKKEIEEQETSFKGRVNIFFGNKKEYRIKLEKEVLPKYFDSTKYLEIEAQKKEIEKELAEITLPDVNGNIIVFCENQNSEVLNNIGLANVSFIPEQNSGGVYIKVRANPDKFGLRDRDYLIDDEVARLKAKFPNYFILDYYCFENYLYHPDNLSELNLDGFNQSDYRAEIIRQKQIQKDNIISIYKKSRDSYQELKIGSEKIKNIKDDKIIEYLNSDDLEVFFKSYSMKDYFDKTQLQKYNLTEKVLSSTNWFKVKFSEIIKME